MVNRTKLEKAHGIFSSRKYAVSKISLLNSLECSPSTLKRIIKTLRDEYGAPLIFDDQVNGYRYTNDKFEFNLPSFWFSPNTLLSLVGMQKLLSQLKLDFLNDSLSQLRQQIELCLKKQKIKIANLDRIRILPINARINDYSQFQLITSSLLQRNTLNITYYSRNNNELSHRVVSPQRLALYKDNWYLDAWCHLRQQIRMFALDGIREINLDDTQCLDIPDAELDQILATGYGIFSGNATHTATLVFSAQRARWVSVETWHPKQQTCWLADGRYQLDIPYSDKRELLMDIQRHLPEVEVVAPPELKQALIQHLQQAIHQHEKSEKR